MEGIANGISEDVSNRHSPEEQHSRKLDIHSDTVPIPFPVKRKKPITRRILLAVLLLAVVGFGAMEGQKWWTNGRFMLSTDDAYVKADITGLAPEASGRITAILTANNISIAKGQPIAKLDDRDALLAVSRAKAALAQADTSGLQLEAQIGVAKAGIVEARAALRSANSKLDNAKRTYTRTSRLLHNSIATKARFDDTVAARDQALAGQQQAQASIETAKASLNVLETQREEVKVSVTKARISLEAAQLSLGRTTINAPVSGTLSNFHLAVGNMVATGQRIGSIVPTDSLYIEAYYKETKTSHIRPNATATVEIDALPGHSFVAHVQSIAAATGSEFAVLPAQNATGNFTKIVQRVPVRISVPQSILALGKLRAGLSVVVSVDRRTGNDDPS